MENEEGVPVYEDEQIASVICKFYEEIFKSSGLDGAQTIDKALKPCINQQTNEDLIRKPTPQEIKEATFVIHPDKALGPDGFSASFF